MWRRGRGEEPRGGQTAFAEKVHGSWVLKSEEEFERWRMEVWEGPSGRTSWFTGMGHEKVRGKSSTQQGVGSAETGWGGLEWGTRGSEGP